MGFVFERRARSRKARGGLRALLGKAPDAREVRERLGRLLPRSWKDATVQVTAKRVVIEAHPFVAPLRVTVDDDGALELRGPIEAIGPGYAEHAIAQLTPVLDELDYAWEPADDIRPALLDWLAGELRDGARKVAMPADRSFVSDAIQTPLGPRDAAWRDAVLADPAAGRDIFAWWDDAPGHAERSRALLAMWHEVPWREPLDKDERAIMKRIDADLRAARKADPALALPYAEWADIAGYLGDDERAQSLRARATGPAAIGYRRLDMTVEPGDGWSLTLPGSFVGRWEDERYWSTDGQRTIELITIATTERDSAVLLAAAEPRHPIVDRIADGSRHGRAEVYDEGDVHIVHGLIAAAPYVAILTCKGAASDEAWALATWRSLRHGL